MNEPPSLSSPEVVAAALKAETEVTAETLAREAADKAETLAGQAAALAKSVAGLRLAVDQLDRRASRSGRVLTVAVLGLVLDLTLSVIVAFALFQLNVTSQRLETQIADQYIVRTRVLCPLYGLFLQSYNPQGPTAKVDPQRYEDSFATIRVSYGELNCPNPVATPPPR